MKLTKGLKFLFVCLLCIGLVTILVLVIEHFNN